jgi:hypothetical protein
MDFNPIPDSIRSDSRYIEPEMSSVPVNPFYRNSFARAEKERDAFLAKRREVMKKASDDPEALDESSIFSGNDVSLRSLNSLETDSISFDKFSGDLRVRSQRDVDKEKVYDEVHDSRTR